MGTPNWKHMPRTVAIEYGTRVEITPCDDGFWVSVTDEHGHKSRAWLTPLQLRLLRDAIALLGSLQAASGG